MNSLLKILTAGALALATATAAAADPFPSKPIRIIVPFAPGAALDNTTRFLAQKMAETLGQPVIVDNRPGGEALIGIRAAKAAPPDGYTLLTISNVFAQAPALKSDAGYEAKDFVGIGGMNETPLVMVTAPSQPDATLAQFLARAKANPNTLSYASGGVGTTVWMATTMALNQAGVKATHVPYKGIAAAAPDVLAGRVTIMIDTIASAGPLIKDGKLRAYGVSTAARLSSYPEIPTLAEQGIAGFNYSVYHGMVAPAGTPPDVVKKLADALRAAVNSEEFRQRNRRENGEVMALSGEEYMARVRQDYVRTTRLMTEMGLAKQ